MAVRDRTGPSGSGRAADLAGGRRLRARGAGALLGPRSAVPSAGAGDQSARPGGGRVRPLRPVGSGVEGRFGLPLHRRNADAGARRHDGANHASGSAGAGRGCGPGRKPAEAVPHLRGPRRSAPLHRRQDGRARCAPAKDRRRPLSRRAERQGRQGRAARPQHPVLDRPLPGAGQRARAGGAGGPADRARAAQLPRGDRLPVAGAYPAASGRRTGRGEADLRFPARDRPAHGLARARRRTGGRALHAPLFPGRTRGRRPDPRRLGPAGGAPAEEGGRAGARPVAADPAPPGQAGLRRSGGGGGAADRHRAERLRPRPGASAAAVRRGGPAGSGPAPRRLRRRDPFADAGDARPAARSARGRGFPDGAGARPAALSRPVDHE